MRVRHVPGAAGRRQPRRGVPVVRASAGRDRTRRAAGRGVRRRASASCAATCPRASCTRCSSNAASGSPRPTRAALPHEGRPDDPASRPRRTATGNRATRTDAAPPGRRRGAVRPRQPSRLRGRLLQLPPGADRRRRPPHRGRRGRRGRRVQRARRPGPVPRGRHQPRRADDQRGGRPGLDKVLPPPRLGRRRRAHLRRRTRHRARRAQPAAGRARPHVRAQAGHPPHLHDRRDGRQQLVRLHGSGLRQDRR